jgi:hypothetical protein
MKKVILIITALVMMTSGVAAVSAYEAHIINVTAHVENALTVDSGGPDIDFGVMFPQEWQKVKKTISLSTSALDELNLSAGQPLMAAGDLKKVHFEIFVEWKEDKEFGTAGNHLPDVDIGGTDYWAWIGDWVWVAFPAATQTVDNPVVDPTEWTYVGAAPVPPALARPTGHTAWLGWDFVAPGPADINLSDVLDVLFLAPAFEGYYNAETDIYKPEWWPFAANPIDGGYWAPIPETGDARYIPDGVDLGMDIKIQVKDIERVAP